MDDDQNQVQLPLQKALRTYWKNMIGVALFPSVSFIGGEVFHIPFEVFLLPFFAVFLHAGWPCFKGKAPYMFWIVALGIYMAGGYVAIILLEIIRAFTA